MSQFIKKLFNSTFKHRHSPCGSRVYLPLKTLNFLYCFLKVDFQILLINILIKNFLTPYLSKFLMICLQLFYLQQAQRFWEIVRKWF